MIQVLLLMLTGWLVGLAFRGKKKVTRWVDRAILIAIFLLLFFMGLSIGSNQLLVGALPTLGLNALIIAVGATIGSVILGWFAWKLVFSSTKKTTK